ncbi:MAG: heavy-metal-associated domain-containing protein [Planctomycetes bacterium]|nr:heavy-metal-associated domain-containing protein [Planctomycetota bacterium]
MRFVTLLTTIFVALSSSYAHSATVAVRGTHLCCGGCQASADEALSDVEGISAIACDLNTKVISYQAASDKAAAAGIEALATAGFYGTATHGAKKLPYPESGAKKGMKANSIMLTGVHLCCTACVSGSQKALVDVKGVTLIDIDRNEKTIKLTGDAINVPEAVAALNKAGFYCRLPKKKQQ